MTSFPHYNHPSVTWAMLEAEIRRELGARGEAYPRLVDKGNMAAADADYQIALARAWLEDVLRIRTWRSGAAERFERFLHGRRDGMDPPPATHRFTWADRRRGLLRELDLRRRLYPEWVGKGNLLAADAERQIACLECLLEIYEDGWDWRSSTGRTPNYGRVEIRTREDQLARDEFAAVIAEVGARKGTAQQEMFA